MKSEEYGYLNKICIIIRAVDRPMWMEELLLGPTLSLDKELQAIKTTKIGRISSWTMSTLDGYLIANDLS